MTAASLKVEVAFTNAPLDTAPTWVDISAYVQAIATRTGRKRELDAFDVGTLSLTLDNTDRRFDPFNASGPYYGNLLPNKQVRLTATYSATTYDMWYGYIDGWPQSYAPPAQSKITITASDAFKLLATMPLGESVYYNEVMADTPTAWWRFGEQSGTLFKDSSGNGWDATLTGVADRSAIAAGKPLLRDAAQASVDFGGAGGSSASATIAAAMPMGSTYVVEFWVFSTTYTAGTYLVGLLSTAGLLEVALDSTSVLIDTFPNGKAATSTSIAGYDSKLHHIVVKKAGSAVTIWVDGATQIVSTTGTPGDTGSAPRFLFPGISATGGFTPPVRLEWAEVAVYPTLTGARVLAHYDAGIAAWNGDTTGARAQRVLDLKSWPSARYDLDTGNNSVGVAVLKNRTLADYLRVVESTEQGQCFVNHRNAGKVTFRQRDQRLTATRSTVSQYTFTDDGASVGAYRYENDIEIVYDERDIVNEVKVKWQDGESIVSDATSQSTYGLRSLSVTTELATDSQANDLGNWILSRYKNPTTRVKSITINPAADNTTFVPALDIRINDRVTVRRLPQSSGAAITEDLIVEGIEHRAANGVDQWQTTLRLSSADAGPWWILGTSALGTSTVLAY